MLLRLIIAAVIAVIFSGFYQGYIAESGSIYQINNISMACFIIACVASVLIANLLPASNSGSSSSAKKPAKKQQASTSSDDDADREEGSVKWFNVSKGFGFITRENGEDIFVHYRSIRGQGRRRLFDGQAVTFVVIDSDKGLQADDVDVIG